MNDAEAVMTGAPHADAAGAGMDAPVEAWRGFAGTRWQERVDVRDFLQANYTPYEGDAQFLAGPTERTLRV